MEIDLANLPADAEALKALVRTLADAVKSQGLKIAQLEARIAKLKRQQFGQTSEKLAREIEQLELELDELHEDEGNQAAQWPAAVQDFIEMPENRRAGRCRLICRARKRCMNPPAHAPIAVVRCAGSARM
jgi:transposase